MWEEIAAPVHKALINTSLTCGDREVILTISLKEIVKR
jgi:hypothetical protein